MKTRLFRGLAAGALAVLAAGPVVAITHGIPDGDAHPYVGLVVFYDAQGTPLHRCSGTLLSPTVFLTAGHCTFATASAMVWFDPEVTTATGYPFSGGTPGTPFTHPNFDNFASFPNTSDVGVVVLSDPVDVATYGQLADLDALGRLATRRGRQDVSFTVVGYGLQEIRPRFQADRVRYQAVSQLVNLRSTLTDGFNVPTTNNPGIGGGTCFGDSGGPVFLNASNVVAAVTSFGLNSNCKGVDFAYRVDIQHAQSFVLGFLD